MSFASFTTSPKGSHIGSLLKAAVPQMERLSQAGRPALLAVAPQIARAGVALTDTEKQHVGRWVHRLLGPRGWRPTEKKRLPKGSLFTTAAVYERVGGAGAPARVVRPAPVRNDPAARLAAVRERVRALPAEPQSVKAFIAEKKRAAARGE